MRGVILDYETRFRQMKLPWRAVMAFSSAEAGRKTQNRDQVALA
jgi:hypothetical protein